MKKAKKPISVILSIIMVFSVFATSIATVGAVSTVWDGSYDYSWQGSGTNADPYLITSAEELAALAQKVACGESYKNVYFELTKDIVLNDTSDYSEWGLTGNDSTVKGPVNTWMPIGSYKYKFRGLFNGNHHAVSGLYTDPSLSTQGLFGCCEFATVKNIKIVDSAVNGSNNVGAVVGACSNSVVSGCSNEGIVRGSMQCGGIAGYLEYSSKLSECCNKGKIICVPDEMYDGVQSYYISGIAGGCSYSSSVFDCYNAGEIVNAVTPDNSGSYWEGEPLAVVTNCYDVNTVDSGVAYQPIIGNERYTCVNCYSLEASRSEGYKFGTSLADEDMKDSSSFAGWDFDKVWGIDNSGYGYPVLRTLCGSSDSYRVVCKDGSITVSDAVYDEGSIFTVTAPTGEYEFAYYEDSYGEKYYAGDEFAVKYDLVLNAVWKIYNTSPDAWNGTFDTDFIGEGTADNPYLITSAEEFAGFAQVVNTNDDRCWKQFKLVTDVLMNDIDNVDNWGYVAPENQWTPIGFEHMCSYSGTFDGDGHTVRGIYVNGRDTYYYGLFGKIAGGTVKNVRIADSYIKGDAHVGGIFGYGASGCTVINCQNDATVVGVGNFTYVGGIGGEIIFSEVSVCGNTGNVRCESDDGFVGGILGDTYLLNLHDLYNSGSIFGNAKCGVGGIIGCNTSAYDNCYNAGTVSGGSISGAIIGYERSTGNYEVNAYYLIGSCSSGYRVGLTEEQMKLEESFAGFDFNKNWEIGYVDGYDYPTLITFGSRQHKYNIVFKEGENILSEGLFTVGDRIPVTAPSNDKYDFAYYEAGNGKRYYEGDVITVSEDMTYTLVWMIKSTDEEIWDGSIDTEWEGAGTEENPYLISSASELAGLAQVVNKAAYTTQIKYYKLTTDIKINDTSEEYGAGLTVKNQCTPIGDSYYRFQGIFDGDGHTVSGIYMKGYGGYQGLFGSIDKNALIKNVGVTDSYFENGASIGGVVAYSYEGAIENCYSTATIVGDVPDGYHTKVAIGGIVGEIRNATVTNCSYFGKINATVSGDDGDTRNYYLYVGGIAGWSCNNVFTGCTNTADVTSKKVSGRYVFIYEGGIVGGYEYTRSTVKNSVNTGDITIINAYDFNAAAGIFGEAGASPIENCFNSGNVTGGHYSAGIACGTSANITNCENRGNIIGKSSVGGITSSMGGNMTVSLCRNFGAVSAIDNPNASTTTGGIAGYAYSSSQSSIVYCYNAGSVTGNNTGTRNGGIAGSIGAEVKIENCYNIGAISNLNPTHYNSSIGGIAGRNNGKDNVINSYYLNTCASSFNDNSGTALTDEQMKTAEAYAGFDFEENWEIGVEEGYDYPTLRDFEYITPVIPEATPTVTFVDDDGTTVLKSESVRLAADANPPKVANKRAGNLVYTFVRWDGDYKRVTSSRTLKAVYKCVEVIKLHGSSSTLTVENSFSREELKIMLESYFTRRMLESESGSQIMRAVEWDIDEYNPDVAGDYSIYGSLKANDTSAFYEMAENEKIVITVTVLPKEAESNGFDVNDITYTISEKKATVTGYTGNATEIIIPEKLGGYEVCAIAEGAFENNTSISVIAIPKTVKIIGDNAFKGCTSLVQVSFAEGVEAIGANAFENTSIAAVTIPASVIAVGERAFGYSTEADKIKGFEIYGYADTAAADYANTNGFVLSLISEKSDSDTGVSVTAEENVCLAVAEVEDGAYYENAGQILEETKNVSLYNITIENEDGENTQPGNTMTVRIPLPEGFDPLLCSVYRVNADGTYKNMNCVVIDGYLCFSTTHLSYYAVLEKVCHHEYNDYSIDVKPTATTAGSRSQHCAFCSDYKNSKSMAALDTAKKGDINLDGRVASADVLLLKKYSSGTTSIYDDFIYSTGDMNSDNRINSRDVLALKKQIAGIN